MHGKEVNETPMEQGDTSMKQRDMFMFVAVYNQIARKNVHGMTLLPAR